MPGLINYGTGQYGAVAGGRRRRFPYREMIEAAQPQIYAAKAREEDIAYRKKRLAAEATHRERVLAQAAEDLEARKKAAAEAARIAQAQSELRRQQLAESKKQAETGAWISGTQTAALGGYLGYKAFGGGAAATAGGVTAGPGTGTIMTGGGGGGWGTAAQYAGAAAGGYVAGRYLGKPLGEAHIPTSLVRGRRSRGRWGGMAAGAATGFAIGGPWGAALGAGAGYFGAGGDCIIITAATSPYSYEVDLARIFRDEFLGPITLRGYYMIADKLVPLMRKSALFKKIVKKHLTDHFTKYGEWVLGIAKRQPYKSKTITKNFLKLCRFFGSFKPFYMRSNGEIV